MIEKIVCKLFFPSVFIILVVLFGLIIANSIQ